jgi:hypothetical protein
MTREHESMRKEKGERKKIFLLPNAHHSNFDKFLRDKNFTAALSAPRKL